MSPDGFPEWEANVGDQHNQSVPIQSADEDTRDKQNPAQRKEPRPRNRIRAQSVEVRG